MKFKENTMYFDVCLFFSGIHGSLAFDVRRTG